MENSLKISLLKQTDLLKFFDESTLAKLVEHCREISLSPKEVLFHEDDLENAMYLILEGELEVFKGPKQIAVLGPGHYLGEMSLIESKARSASARAEKPTLLMEINEEHFHTYLASEPQALLSIMRTLSGRVRSDLETMMKDMRQLSIFTHDIRNYLSTLGLAELTLEDTVELLGGTDPNHKKRAGLEDMEKCQHVVQKVRVNLMELLDSSLNHVKKIKTEYKKSKYQLLPVIEETVAGLATHPQLQEVTINVHSQGDSLEAVFNPLDIQRVLQNLIINAGYVTEGEGTIDVGISRNDGNLKVSVTDYGCGIPEDVQGYLFKDSLTTKSDGNGLGLLSCKGIIEENHQGNLWFETEEGKGTTFHFTLPAPNQVLDSN
ncbi:MAG: HAMP domain-containing histidine kinase [Nitrospinae bacterium]|nr:HAMP domain-containing histidine kinase [Nitrospinota bacterium]